VGAEVAPALADLRAKLNGVSRRAPARFGQSVRGGVLPIVASVFVGMPLMQALALSAGVVVIQTAWESYAERKEVLELNGLSYLLRVDNG
jgi:hypothetical protein